MISFSDQLGTINNVLRKLQYISTAEQQAVLNGFVQQYVFAVQEEGLPFVCGNFYKFSF